MSDDRFELVLERDVEASPEALFHAWVTPELLMQWFCPLPWRVTQADIDLKPGGRFHTVMAGPDGEVVDNGDGCFLEVVPNRRLTFTDALKPGFRPAGKAFMTATVTFEPLPGGGTRYRAVASHPDAETRKQHEDMGFHGGWNMALDQLLALVAKQPA